MTTAARCVRCLEPEHKYTTCSVCRYCKGWLSGAIEQDSGAHFSERSCLEELLERIVALEHRVTKGEWP